MSKSAKVVSIDLTDEERHMLYYGLIDWGGPSECTESLAVAMGFSGLDDLDREGPRIAAVILAREALPVRDWSRALFSTEVIYASEVVGTGSEWGVVQGGTDAHWIDVLRSLQRKVPTSKRFLGP